MAAAAGTHALPVQHPGPHSHWSQHAPPQQPASQQPAVQHSHPQRQSQHAPPCEAEGPPNAIDVIMINAANMLILLAQCAI